MKDSPAAPQDSSASDSAPVHRRPFFSLWCWGLFLTFVVYPLSLGPAVKLLKSHPAIRPVIEVVYAPLAFLADRWSLLYDFLDWYIKTVWKVQ